MKNNFSKMTAALLLGSVFLAFTPQSANADLYSDPFGFSHCGGLIYPPPVLFPFPLLLPDLVIEQIHVIPGQEHIALVKVRNIGFAKATPSHVSAHNNTGVGVAQTGSLDINQSEWCVLSMFGNATLGECSSLTLFQTDTFMEVAEMNEHNNIKFTLCQ